MEKYYINNDKVLLYKIINWWYDTPAETYQICGSHISHKTSGSLQISYDPAKKTITFNTKEYFAELLSVFKECSNCWGPSYFKLTWLNKAYFGDGTLITSVDKHQALTSYMFTNIKPEKARRLEHNAGLIELELEGVICGLMNGKIALHQSGDLLKSCQTDSETKETVFPITLKMINSQTNEVLAKFSMVFEKNHKQHNHQQKNKLTQKHYQP